MIDLISDDQIDVVYIPPDGHSITDEEAIDDESPLEKDLWVVEIAETYEIHIPKNDSSVDERLAMKQYQENACH